MELRVNDYVRTKKGIIGKIKAIDNQTQLEDLYLVKRQWYYKEDFIKSSPNIIDLIEVGDYVNGYMVENIDAGLNGDIIEIATGTNYFQNPSLYNEDIKSIVTKEQFESMEYRIGE